MGLVRVSLVAARRILLDKLITTQAQICQQSRCYRLPPLPTKVTANLDRVRKPFIPDESSSLTQEWQKKPEVVKEYKRKAWAKFGSLSGVDLKEILPTKKEIIEEWEAEKEWWPSLQEMKDNVEKERREKEQEKAAYEKKVAENLAKMPKWIEQWKVEQEKLKDRETEVVRKKEDLKQRALEEIDYKMDPDSRQFRDYLQDFAQKERLTKKKEKKLAKRVIRK